MKAPNKPGNNCDQSTKKLKKHFCVGFFARRNQTIRHKNQKGFAIAPILYLLMMAGVAAGVLFSGYSQILRANLNVTNATTAKGDLSGGITTLAATSVLSDDQTIFCPPRGATPTADCADAPQKLVAIASAESAKVPVDVSVASASGTPLEVGVFAAGAGVKQLDPWGRYYIYCRWENPRSSPDALATAVISAGANGKIETGCGDSNPKGDDQMNQTTVGESINRASVWQQSEDDTTASFGMAGANVTVSADGIISAQGMILSQTATMNAIVLGTALGISSGGTGATTAPDARVALGAGTIGDSLFTSTTASGARSTLGATAMGDYLFSSSALVASTASSVRSVLLGAGTVGNDVFLSATTSNARAVLGATTMGDYLFSASALDASIAAQTRTTLLGASTIGEGVFTAASVNAALTSLGATSLGMALFQATTEAIGRTALGAGAEGSLLFTATSQLHAWQILGLTGTLNPTLNVDVSGAAGSVDAENLTGGAVPIIHGGTSATTASSALDNLFGSDSSPSSTLNVARLGANSINSTKLTDVVASGTYNLVEVDTAGRVISGSYVAYTPDQITDDSGDGITATATGGGYLYFSTASTIQMALSPLGYLGIGTLDPKERLHVNDGNIRVSGAAGTSRELQFTTGETSKRWTIGTNAVSESGSSAGSNFMINRVTDGGTEINALTIDRSTGQASFAGPVSALGGFLGVFTGTFSGEFVGGMILGDTAATTSPHRVNDETTGFYSDAANSVSVATAGVERLRITGTGSIGIGTGDPEYMLDVSGDARTNLIHFTGTTTAAGAISGTATGTAGAIQYNDGNNNLAGDASLVWDAANLYLGINTDAPRAALDAGYHSGAIILPVGSTGQRPASAVKGMIRYNDTTGSFEGYQGSSAAWASLGAGGTSGTYLGGTVATTNPSRSDDVTTGLFSDAAGVIAFSNTGVETLRLTATGSVGLGTQTPAVSFDMGTLTDAIGLPSGTSEQRPSSAANGMMRYNTTLGAFEGYTASGWGALGGSGSGASGISGQSMAEGWPDAIVCTTSGGSVTYLINALPSTSGKYVYRYMSSTTGSNWNLSFNADGSYYSMDNNTTSDCGTNTWSISQLIANGLAFNTVNSSTSNAIAMDDGTAGAPGLYFGTDTNTGLYRPTDDTLGLANGGVESLRIDANGAIGMKTTTVNAGAILDLASATGTAFSSLILPSDTTTNRPTTGVVGMMRYNTTLGAFEGYTASGWGSLGSSSSSSGSSESMISGIPDAILCSGYILWSYGNNPSGVWAQYYGITGESSLYMRFYYGEYYDAGTSASSSDCAGKSLAELYTAGKAFNFIGGGSGSSGDLSTDIVLGTSGTATNPHIDGDATTGLFSPAAGTLAVSSSGTEVLRITATGSLGLGTTTPAVALDLGSKTDALTLPVGTTENRPASGAAGMMRYNTTLGAFEGYTASGWGSLGSSSGSSAGSSMLEGWPDAIICKTGTTELRILYASALPYDTSNYVYRNLNETIYIYFTPEGAYSTQSSLGGYDCITNTWSISDFYANGRAFNFIGGGSGTSGDLGADVVLGAAAATSNPHVDGDVTTGLFSPAAGSLAVASSGTEVLRITATGSLGLGTTTPAVALDLGSKTDALTLPVGTTENRPASGAAGMMRYNTTLGAFEGYTASGWGSLGSNSASGLSGDSFYDGWPDAITCSPSGSGPTVYYASHMPHSNGSYYYRSTYESSYITFTAAKNYSSYGEQVPTGCVGKSISQLITDGQAFNLVGGGSSTSGDLAADVVLGAAAATSNPHVDGDVTTGLFSPAAGSLAVASSGTEVLRITATGSLGLGTTTPAVALDLGSKTDALTLPVGTTENRPASGAAGMMRYNTTLGAFEGYTASGWGSLGSSSGSSAGSSMVSGWPDAIACISGATTVILRLDTNTPGGNYTLYRDSQNTSYLRFLSSYGSTSAATLFSGLTGYSCTTKSIDTLYADGQAFNFIGGGSGTSGDLGADVVLGAAAATSNPHVDGDVTTGLYSPAAGVVAFASGGSEMLRITATGSIGVGVMDPGYPLVIGNSTSNGNGAFLSKSGIWTNISDARVKENVRDLPYDINDLMKLKPVAYEMIGTHEKQVGFIAQDVEKVLPEIVAVSKEGRYGLSYGNMEALTVKSIQQLKKQSDAMAENIEIMKRPKDSDDLLVKVLVIGLSIVLIFIGALYLSMRRKMKVLEAQLLSLQGAKGQERCSC